jgi:esterase/lipase
MLKKMIWVVLVIIIASVIFLTGPKPMYDEVDASLPEVTSNLSQLEEEIKKSELGVENLKPDNEARIVWADTTLKQKTRYSIIYIHGFGASWAEGDPIHQDLAKKYGANLYLARMHGAGVNDPNVFQDLTPENFIEGAKRALAIGKVLGDSVIVMGTSAGGLLSVFLAANHPEVKGLILYSPCMKIATTGSTLVTGPWGRQILNLISGTHRSTVDADAELAKYWLQQYHTNGIIALQQTIDLLSQPSVFEKIKMPVFLGYYYKNEQEQDEVVSVDAMQKMFVKLGTPSDLKTEQAFPETADHVIGSHLRSKDVKSVYEATDRFFQEKLKMIPVSKSEN